MSQLALYGISAIRLRPTGGLANQENEAIIYDASDTAMKHFHRSVTIQQEDIGSKFKALFWNWKIDVAYESSVDKMILHSSYQQIIGLGRTAVPLMLEELQREPSFLFPALAAITGVNPVNPEHDGDLNAMTKDWVEWGRAEKII